jgi:putative sterol carrier protein
MTEIDPSDIGPEEFATLVANSSDDVIGETIHSVGTEATLDRIFKGFEERFRPEKAEGVEADVQFMIKDDKEEHGYVVAIHGGACTASRATSDDPKTTLSLKLVPFVKLVTGQADGMKLFMTRKLKISGDMMFAQRVMTFFDRPSAS